MVTRKNTWNNPTIVTAGATDSPTSLYSADRMTVGSTESPYPPSNLFNPNMSHSASYTDAGNPWSDQPSHQSWQENKIPDILTPGYKNPAAAPVIQSRGQGVPDVPSMQISSAQTANVDTPRSSLDSQRSKDFWDEDDEDDKNIQNKSPERKPAAQFRRQSPDLLHGPEQTNEVASNTPSLVRRKPVPGSPSASNTDFASNNPFRQPEKSTPTPPTNKNHLLGGLGTIDQSTRDGRNPPMGNLATRSSPRQEFLSRAFSSMNIGNTNNSQTSSHDLSSEATDSVNPWGAPAQPVVSPAHPNAPPPPLPQLPRSPPSDQPPLILASPKIEKDENPWSTQPATAPTPSPIPFTPSQQYVSKPSDSLLDRGQETGVVSLADELGALPNSAVTAARSYGPDSLLLDDSDAKPPLPIRPAKDDPISSGNDFLRSQDQFRPPQPPRPIITRTQPSEAEIALATEQRNETYQIKHFNWFDNNSNRLRRSSMLTQNKNGPCPLLALVNALILGASDASQAVLDQALQAREQVTLGLIIETLMDELLSRGLTPDYAGSSSSALPDVDELNGFLMRLRTGMNANPRFVPPRQAPPNLMDARQSVLDPARSQRNNRAGRFESTSDIKLYGAFSIPLLHGWLPDEGSTAYKAFARSAPTYEDAQAVQFAEEELEYKLNQSGLSDHEQTVFHDIKAIKEFFGQHPTQLTAYGLEVVQDSLSPGGFAILFRNDHFSTIYKHPESGKLFTLITDAGYADRDEVIWESLVDIQGNHNEFFSGDFRPVSHNQDVNRQQTPSHSALFIDPSGNVAGTSSGADMNMPLSPQELQEQHDADFAMALQLQEEEEQRQRAENARRRSQQQNSSNPPPGRSSPGRGAGAGNTRRRNNDTRSDSPSSRPTIPPRNQHQSSNPRPAVTRPADANVDDAPPAYEEAARGAPYVPPVSSPLHPAYTSNNAQPPNIDNEQYTGVISSTTPTSTGPATLRRQDPRRRSSAYGEMNYHSSSSPNLQGGHPGMGGRSSSMNYGLNTAQMPGGYGARPGFGMPSRGSNQQQQNQNDRECVVM